MLINKRFSLALLTAAIALPFLSGCYPHMDAMVDKTVNHIARPAFLVDREIKTDQFVLTAYERIYDRKGTEAIIYVAGDGDAWISTGKKTQSPTPKNPVALHLASRDNHQNVIYLGRPCQHTPIEYAGTCHEKYWNADRYAPEVVQSINQALDNIKNKYGFKTLHLVGYDGGAAVSIIAAAGRNDIGSIRTVAGNLDHAAYSIINSKDELSGSLNAIDVASQVANIPQHHFIGDWDKTMPLSVFENFYAESGPTNCIKATVVKEATHDAGWVSVWPNLLEEPVDCNPEH